MAYTFIKQPVGIYPAYNDSFLEFTNSLTNPYKAELTFNSIPGISPFLIYPDENGVFNFNMKNIVKIVLNENGFKDVNFFTSGYYKNISGQFTRQSITIKTFGVENLEEVTKFYDFYRGVKQIGEKETNNDQSILSYSDNSTDFYLTYFEGFPFHFDLKYVPLISGQTNIIKVKNLNTGDVSEDMPITVSGAYRVNIDLGGSANWTSDNFLPLNDNLNRLEVYLNDTFKNNILLTKKTKCSGVYLKWFNREGGFSHFLFDRFYNEEVKGQTIDYVLNNEFENVFEASGSQNSIGKNGNRKLNVKAKYTQNDYQILRDIFTSPSIQMYTSELAYTEGRFIDVEINGTFRHSNKRAINEIQLSIDLGAIQTATL